MNLFERVKHKISEPVARKELKLGKFILAVSGLFRLLFKMLSERRVDFTDKLLIGFTIAYLISPIDLIPDGVFGPFSYVDDILLVVFVMRRLRRKYAPIMVESCAGDREMVAMIERLSSHGG